MSVESASFRARVRASIEDPVGRVFGRLGFTPNALTLIGFGIAVVAAWAASQQAWLAAGLLVAFGAAFDLFDGALARATNRTSNLGAFLDSVFDRAGEAVVYVGIAIGLMAVRNPSSGFELAVRTAVDSDLGVILAAAAMAASFMVSYTRAKSESLDFSPGTGMANIGLAPREVRTAILSVALIVAGLLPNGRLEIAWWIVLVGALGLIAILATLTTIQRILFVYRQSKSAEVNK